MPFPAVAGGQGSTGQLTANVGLPIAMNAKLYDGKDGKVGAWLRCITENYGGSALKDQGAITGFKPAAPVTGVPALTTQTQELIAGTSDTVVWFEAFFNTKATTTSQTNAAPLVTGELSPADFMAKVQTDNAGS
jgi:raffinose/stachyose/melibiose transport system substrate-binding protein